VPVTSPTRTIIDLATHLDAAALTIAVDSALRDGLTSDDFLHRRLVALRSKGRYGIPKLLAVVAGAEIARGGHSWLEREFLRLMAQAQLPAPLTQQVLARRGTRLVRVDCRFADTPVVVELLGYRFHRSPQQMRVDAERANQLLLAGFLPFQFTYLQVVEEPAMVVATVAAALGIHRTLPITPISAS
jgi:very-short-patch-repair endonuclease